jgi:hypothetical protein
VHGKLLIAQSEKLGKSGLQYKKHDRRISFGGRILIFDANLVQLSIIHNKVGV